MIARGCCLACIGLVLLAGFGFYHCNTQLASMPRPDPEIEMQVALPRFVQVAMAAGDRYLAANLAVYRAMVVSTEKMRPQDYVVLGKVQADAAWLNPAHEDNYYIAAAILPWNGEYEAAQAVLQRAALARTFDYQPAFYYAFNLLQFKKDPVAASHWLQIAAGYTKNDQHKMLLESLAARWIERNDSLDLSIEIVERMADNARHKGLRDYLMVRVSRLKMLKSLRVATQAYQARFGHGPERLEQLVSAGFISDIPADPFGMEFRLDENRLPILAPRERK